MFLFDKDIERIQEGFSKQLDSLSAEYSKIIDSKNEEIKRYQEIIGHYEKAFGIIRKIAENHEQISSTQEKIVAENLSVIQSLKLLLEKNNGKY